MILIYSFVLGIAGTLMFDLWGIVMKRVFGIPPSDICLVGRWICHMPAGTFRHPNIMKAEPKRWECPVGWSVHYGIGMMLAMIFLLIVGSEWLQAPTILPALLFGFVSVLAPFLIMQPAFGLGIAASRSPRPAQARLRSILNHTAFGFWLFIAASLLRSLSVL